jgi:ABC-2 type transport system permease protein
MKKFWLVFAYEYRRHVLRKRFLIALLSLPLLVGISLGAGLLAVAVQNNYKPVGYVYAPQIFSDPQNAPSKPQLFSRVEIRRYEDESSALADLKAGKLQAYYVFAPTYLTDGKVTMVADKAPAQNATSDFEDFLRYNLIRTQPADVVHRLNEGTSITVQAADGSRQMKGNNFLVFLLPFVSGLLFVVVINTSGSYLLQAVVEEKENRTMEIVVTSVSPEQLMWGKTAGNLSVGLTQLLVWLVFCWMALMGARLIFPDLAKMQLDFTFLPLMLAVLLPAFVMVAALMATIGATATQAREAQQVAALFTLPIVVPYWFITPLMFNPNGGLSIGMSLFPLTAPVAMPMRAAFATIPAWQIALSVGLLVLSAAGALWLSARAFRMGMLRYGKRLSLKELFSRQRTVSKNGADHE